MLIQRALSLFRRLRSPSQFAVARMPRFTDSSSSSVGSTGLFRSHSALSAHNKHHWGLMLGVILTGPTAFFIGLTMNPVCADNAPVAERVTDNEQGQAYVTDLRRVEDGSVVSNSHTIKWRIFTDNGRDLFLKGKLDEAEKYFQSALQEAKEGFGAKDPHVASSYNNLAELYRVRKAFEKAEPLYLEAIAILEESFGTDDVRVGAALHNLGQFYLAQRKLDKAQKCYERALKIEGRVLGHGHTDYANTLYHLGRVLHLQGKEKDSEALIRESIRILEEGGLGDTVTCVRRMKYLSQMLLNCNRLAEAENLQRKILHSLELSKGWDSLDTIIAAEGLALTLQSLGSLTEAQDLLERCLDARKKVLPHDHIQVAGNMLHLARIAMLKSSHTCKVNPSEAIDELDKAKVHVNGSIRISKAILDWQRKNQTNLQSSSVPNGSAKDSHVALLILLQSLDLVGLIDITRCELQEAEKRVFPIDAEVALHDCISIFKEPKLRSLLHSPDAKREYLSCLKHLINIVSENIDNDPERSGSLQELKDAVRHIEAELSSGRR